MTVSPPPSHPPDSRLIAVIFLLALIFNLWGVSVGWTNITLPGYEFRQTQTAISAQFIQQENNFSLAYPTPVLGAPWSVPFEFPLYQWATVATSNLTHLPLVEAGRAVSVFCFYLGLPALYLLLGRFGVAPPHRLVMLSLVLTCPLYIFYSRAFLIETMALMFGLWYLFALIGTVERRSVGWLLIVNLAGVGAGLVKVTTFIIFVLPAFGWSLWWLWSARPQAGQAGGKPLIRTTAWLVAAHALPFTATLWWLHFSDAVKALNPSGAGLTSAKLVGFNFGHNERFTPSIWMEWWKHISYDVTAPTTLIVAGLAILVCGRRWWKHVAGCLMLFLVMQVIFPVLYATHGYYYVANAFLLLAAIGFAAIGLLESHRLPRWVRLGLWLVIAALQVNLYFQNHYSDQRIPGDGGGLAGALHEITQPGESLVIAGDDWSSIIPYYSQRRALMIRNGLSDQKDYLTTAFNLMKEEHVAALVLMGPQRENTALLTQAEAAFGLNPSPAFTWSHGSRVATAYINRQLQPEVSAIFSRRGFHEVTPGSHVTENKTNPLAGREIYFADLLPRNRPLFQLVNPHPIRFFFSFGPELRQGNRAGEERLATHPDTKLWFALSSGAHEIHTNIDLVPGAWQDVPYADGSDGVGLVAAAIFPDGRRQILQSRYLNPRANPADRGVQPIDWAFDLPAGAEFELSVNAGPAGNGARDWASLGSIIIK